MKRVSTAYLAELAEEFLAGQVAIAWRDFAKLDLRGETIWIDATEQEPGVEVEFNYRRLPDAIEIEVIAYQESDDGSLINSERRIGRVEAEA